MLSFLVFTVIRLITQQHLLIECHSYYRQTKQLLTLIDNLRRYKMKKEAASNVFLSSVSFY